MITVFYKVFNEADFLNESLTTIYPYADKIVILEYCLESMRKVVLNSRVTDRGLSTDGTTGIIKKFPDPDNKIEYRPLGFFWGGENQIYQYMIDDISVGDYMWVIDGDIVYSPDFAKQTKEWIDSGRYDCIWIPEPVFWHDFNHTKKNFFYHHQRVLKKQSDQSFYFAGTFEVKWAVHPGWRVCMYNRPPEEQFEYNGHKLTYKFCDARKREFAYHYGYVKSVQRILEKLLWQYEMIDHRWDNVGAREHCSKFRNPLDFKLQTQDWFTASETENYQVWNLGHPEVMKHNKWSEYRWNEKPLVLDYDEACKLVKWVGEC